MTDKRHDIQGLRAWAVVAVVIFHFFPSLLPFGYLGVDVFFVLSGYLISLVLENKPVNALATYTNFYFKRIRRIFPLLLMIIFMGSIYTVFCYSDMLFRYSEKSAARAAFFITNLKGSNEGESYFRDLEHADDLYTHTWSLSVEIQFYLLAPLLLHVMKPSCPDSFHPIGYLLGLSALSFLYSISSPSAAFYSTIARLWQFTAGSIAFRLQKEEQLPTTTESPKASNYMTKIIGKKNTVIPSIIAAFLIVTSAVFEGWESALRCTVTFSAACILVLKLTTPLLTHRSLQIIGIRVRNTGDSSYALYLIHWPVVCVLRYYDCDYWTSERVPNRVRNTVRLGVMLFCFVVAIVVYETYEKWYLALNENWTAVLIGGLYLASLSVYVIYCITHTEITELGDIDTPRSYNEARILNQYMDSKWEEFIKVKDCTFRDPSVNNNPWGFCYLPPGNGNLSFLIIGNSYAANHVGLIVENLRDHYGRIAVHTVSECEPLIETNGDYCRHPDNTRILGVFLRDIETYNPDVLFISARYIEPNVPIDAQNVTDDSLYRSMMEKLKKYEENVKKVFILDAFPRPARLQKVEDDRIKAGKPIEEFMEETIEADSIPMRRRVEEIAKHCGKCVVYDLMQLHMVNGHFMTSNPHTHLHYFETVRHHTPVGLRLVEPLYRKLSENFDDLMRSNSSNNLLRWNE